MARWWTIFANGVRVGACYASENDVRQAAGPYAHVERGVVIVYGPPPK